MNLNAIDGAALLILGALLVAFYYALRATPRARRDIPIVLNTPSPASAPDATSSATSTTRMSMDGACGRAPAATTTDTAPAGW